MKDITHLNSHEASLEGRLTNPVGCGVGRQVEVDTPSDQVIDGEHSEPTSPCFRKINILLAEDDPILRRFLITALTREEYLILRAGDGIEALVLWHEHKNIDLIVADVNMPGMDGPLLAQAIWRERVTPVLYISGLPPGGLAERHIRDGHARFLAKPFKVEELQKIVQELVEVPRSRTAAQ